MNLPTRIIKTLISNIPFLLLRGMGNILGWIAFAIDKRHRMVVKRNLRFIFPGYSHERLNRLALRVFQNTGLTFLEIIQLIFSSEDQMRKRVEILDAGNHIEALERHSRLILISAHLGNWEVPPLFWAMYFKTPLLGVVRPLDSKRLNRIMVNFRTRYGSTIIAKKSALQKLARGLRKHQSIGMLIDHDVKPSEAIKSNFLGKTVNATPSVAWLARQYNCPVVPVFCIRKPDGKLIMEINPPLNLIRTKNREEDLLVNTQIINDSISKAVLKNVDQWFWFHKRWKRYYPDLYPEETKRLEKRRARFGRG
ncbi:MAG: hypothetical protein KKF30_08795 [Proteobacteria bacterium]|nr:hypothetical protein [Pseudomonadota bacterium]MBU4469959.1 hypothetical protein [Pseudomonadota bacterium]MCG2753721.1 hypothetical protein [Desulfobacteraceae bacterium]